jgi:Protein of unknown function (DUF3592)
MSRKRMLWLAMLGLCVLVVIGYPWVLYYMWTHRAGVPLWGLVIATAFVSFWAVYILRAARQMFGLFGDVDTRLLQRGTPAEARVLEVSDTGVMINYNPVVRLRLEVLLPDRPPSTTDKELLVGRLQSRRYQPGMRLRVWVDPNKPQRVAVEPMDRRGWAMPR